MDIHRIVFVADSGVCAIHQPHTVVGPGDTIRISAQKANVFVLFPHGEIFEDDQLFNRLDFGKNVHSDFKKLGVCVLLLDHTKPPQDFRVKDEAPDGRYPFTAYCIPLNRFAVGGSDGEIIIQS